MTLMLEYSGGTIRRCDKRCYAARTPKCTCICQGRNHQKGLRTGQAAFAFMPQCKTVRIRHPKHKGGPR